MGVDVERKGPQAPLLDPDFTARLETRLGAADRDRRRYVLWRRLRSLLPLVLLVGPIVGWRLMLSFPDGVHVTIAALAWIAFVLDIGVHLDTSLLNYLGLSALPSVVGGLILVVLTGLLLIDSGGDR
jgi:hypothetical protein